MRNPLRMALVWTLVVGACGPSGTRIVTERSEDAEAPIDARATGGSGGRDASSSGGSGGGAGGAGGAGGIDASSGTGGAPPPDAPAADVNQPDRPAADLAAPTPDVAPDTAPAAVELTATADAFVKSGTDSTKNFNTNEVLVKTGTDPNLNRKGYLKFPLTGVTTVGKATLILQAETSHATEKWPLAIHATTNAWMETQITWDMRPAIGARITQITLDPRPLKQYRIDVTTYVRERKMAGDQEISFALDGPMSVDPVMRVVSREGGAATAPKLSVEPM